MTTSKFCPSCVVHGPPDATFRLCQDLVACQRRRQAEGGLLFDNTFATQLIDIDPLEVDHDRLTMVDLAVADVSHGPESVAVVLAATPHRLSKRVLDVFLSLLMLSLTAPLFGLVAFLVWIEDRRSPFYRQTRWGYRGKEFTLLKFRSMRPESEQLFGLQQAGENDHRTTRVGHYLRRFGLDELPQLANILKGDMSFVGPRALAVGELAVEADGSLVDYRRVPGFWQRMAVRPGLTGVATIYLPKDVSPKEKFRQDVAYVSEQSIWLDMKLIFLSFWISVRGKWETRSKKF